jgi:hypothetical protein
MAQLNSLRDSARRGKTGQSDYRSASDYLGRRASLVIPGAVKETIDEWSKSILTSSKAKLDKQKAIAAKSKDIGAGTQVTNGATQAARPAATGKPRTSADILAELRAGTYAPR